MAESSIIDEIAAERRRQLDEENWSPAHDDRHRRGALATAAACYAAPFRIFKAQQRAGLKYEPFTVYRDAWPWGDEYWKPKDRRRDLIRAAALIVAEIERLDRKDRRSSKRAA